MGFSPRRAGRRLGARVQENIGLSLGISGLLMELMRQRDELQSLAVPVREPYDLPLYEYCWNMPMKIGEFFR